MKRRVSSDKVLQPCSRLGHTCDYNPRLSFKDDTPRVVEKILCPGKSKGPVWDRKSLERTFIAAGGRLIQNSIGKTSQTTTD